jgi:hypothetical protein
MHVRNKVNARSSVRASLSHEIESVTKTTLLLRKNTLSSKKSPWTICQGSWSRSDRSARDPVSQFLGIGCERELKR